MALLGAVASSLSAIGLGWVVTNKISYIILSFFVEKYINWMANKGLMLLNFGAVDFTVPRERKAFEAALEAAIKFMENTKIVSTEKIKELDDEVILHYDRFATIKLLNN